MKSKSVDKYSELIEYLDKKLGEINSSKLSPQEADHYSEEIIDEIEEVYNLFGAEGTPKAADQYIIDKISMVYDTLLSNGLDVNSDSDENALNSCIWIENKAIAIMLAKKFLENGANPNLKLTSEGGESLYDYLNFAVGYDKFGDNSFMRIWLLLMAYGGCDKNGDNELVMRDGFNPVIFKNIDNYAFRVECREGNRYVMHFDDIRTCKEVAIYEKLFVGM